MSASFQTWVCKPGRHSGRARQALHADDLPRHSDVVSMRATLGLETCGLLE